MHFGIMAMQMDSLIPSDLTEAPPEKLLAEVMGFDHTSMIQNLVDGGFNPIELNGI